MEYSANLYCIRLCNNKQGLPIVKNSKIVVVVRQRSDFYDSHSLRSVADAVLFESKGGLVFSAPMFSGYSHGEFRGFLFSAPSSDLLR